MTTFVWVYGKTNSGFLQYIFFVELPTNTRKIYKVNTYIQIHANKRIIFNSIHVDGTERKLIKICQNGCTKKAHDDRSILIHLWLPDTRVLQTTFVSTIFFFFFWLKVNFICFLLDLLRRSFVRHGPKRP